MARQSILAHHPQILLIERELLAGTPQRIIAERFGITQSALARWVNRDSAESIESTQIDSNRLNPLKRLKVGQARDYSVRDLFRDTDLCIRLVKSELKEVRAARINGGEPDHRTMNMYVNTLLKCIELFGRLKGQIKDELNINIGVPPEWNAFAQEINNALEPYPEARQAYLEALERIELSATGQ